MTYVKKHKMLLFIILMAVAAIAMVASIGIFGGDISADTTPLATWTFQGIGFYPRHLPDVFTGQVALANLIDVPWQIQGIYHESGEYWAYNAPEGSKPLRYLLGGKLADYSIGVAGAIEWEIPLTTNVQVTIPPINIVTSTNTTISDLYWKDYRNYNVWRNIKDTTLPIGENIESHVSWWNPSYQSIDIRGHIEVSIKKANGVVIPHSSLYVSNNDRIDAGGTAVMFRIPLIYVPLGEQGIWEYTATLTDTVTNEFYDSQTVSFTVGVRQ